MPTKQDVMQLGAVLQQLVGRVGRDLAMQQYRQQLADLEQQSLIPKSVRVRIPGEPDAQAQFVPGQANSQYSGVNRPAFMQGLAGAASQGNPLAASRFQYEQALNPVPFTANAGDVYGQVNKVTGQHTVEGQVPFKPTPPPALTPYQIESLKLRKEAAGRGSAADARFIAESRGKLKSALSVVQSFESNPDLVSNYQKIIKDPQLAEATKSGDVDLAQTIMAKLLGDTTPQRILTKRYTDYINAQNDIERETEVLTRLHEPNIPKPLKKNKESIPINY